MTRHLENTLVQIKWHMLQGSPLHKPRPTHKVPNKERLLGDQLPQGVHLHPHRGNNHHRIIQVPDILVCLRLVVKVQCSFTCNSFAADLSRVFKSKLFAIAKEDSEVHDLWYDKGRRIKEANPELNQKEWFQRIVKAVYDEVRINKKLYQKVRPVVPLSANYLQMCMYTHAAGSVLQIWSYNENAAQQRQGSAAAGPAPVAQAPGGAVQGTTTNPQQAAMQQQAQPLVPVGPVAPGAPRPVVGTAVPLGAAVAQAPQPRGPVVRPGQAMPLQPGPGAPGAPQYPVYANAAMAQRPAYHYQQYAQPGMVRPQMAPQFTEAQRKKAEEDRLAKEEQKRREQEEKRQRNIEEQARKLQAKKEREEIARQKKLQAEADKLRRAQKRQDDKRKRDEQKEQKRLERERLKAEKGKGRKRPAANKSSTPGGSLVPSPADDTPDMSTGGGQGKKRPPARKQGAFL